jgi:predicted RNase H-like HicB family nuclease/predicted HTH domain antitoxin
MLTEYLAAALSAARFEIIKDEVPYYGSIPALTGVWATGRTRDECQRNLASALGDWVFFSIARGEEPPTVNGISLVLPKTVATSRDRPVGPIVLECPAELSVALGKRPAEAGREIQLMAALRLYEFGRISSGLAARLAGMSRAEFIVTCGQFGVSIFQQTPEELAVDTANAGNRYPNSSTHCPLLGD